MAKEDDLILGESEIIENDTRDLLDIIDMQLIVINSVSDLDASIYDDIMEHKVKIMVRAMKLIAKVQDKLLKDV
jgi:hypothetical protein